MLKFRCAFILLFLSFLTFLKMDQSQHHADRDWLHISGAREALDLLANARRYPRKTLPQTGVIQAFETTQRTFRKALAQLAATQQLASWHAIGPDNIGGRTLSLAINPLNPKTVYAGSASGGLWLSRTGGLGLNAWQRVRTGFPVLAVATIAIAANDTNAVYIGTGEVYGSPKTFPGITGERTTRGSYGIGILKSSDGGKTWNKSLDWSFAQQRGVQMIKIDPQNSNMVWAATTEGTFKSVDGGGTWKRVLDVVMGTDIEINSADPDVVFVGCGGMGGPGHGIYRTTDGGDTWEKAGLLPGFTFNGKVRLAMSPSNPDIVYASIGKSSGSLFGDEETGTWLFRTADGGDSWSLQSTIDYTSIQGWYAHDVAVHPTHPEIVWTAGQPSSPLRSKNGGLGLTFITNLEEWQSVPENAMRGLSGSWADFHHIEFHPTNPDIIYFTNDGGIFRTDDAGLTVRNLSHGYQTTQFYNGTSSSFTDSLFTLGGLQDNNSAAYRGNRTWIRLFAGDGAWTAIDQDEHSIFYLSYQFLNISRFTDVGSIDVSPLHDVSRTNFIAPFVLGPDNRTLYAGSNFVHKSLDRGTTWFTSNGNRPLDSNPLIAMTISEQTPDVVYAATSPGSTRGEIFRTVDGGVSWLNITGSLPDRFLTDIAVNPRDDQYILVTLGGFGSSHLFKSADGGSTWQDIGAGLPDIPTWSVIVDPDFPEHLFVGNDIAIFMSPDGGGTWVPYMEGLPDAIFAMDLTISRANRKLRVATHGNGFYETPLPDPAPVFVDKLPEIPRTFALAQNFPNPFNPTTTIQYFLAESGPVQLKIYNTAGQEVRALANKVAAAGAHQTVWDGTNNAGHLVATGTYIYRLKAGNVVLSKRMSFVR